MNTEAFKKRFGDEYPAAVHVQGERLPLASETRWTRHYQAIGRKHHVYLSKFMDGAASISLAELDREWPKWSPLERLDFCNACHWLHEQADYPDMLRLIMKASGPTEWSSIASSVAANLPPEEAFEFLLRALRKMKLSETSNISQAIAITKHPLAEITLRSHLSTLWQNASLWDDDRFINWVALAATTCIANLLELGAQSSDFEEQARALSKHVCTRNRDSCRRDLGKHYAWL